MTNFFFTLLLGIAGGFTVHAVTMKVSFKQRTIDNKIKIFDSIIGTWVKMRNFVFAHHPGHPVDSVPLQISINFDQMYGQSQQLIGETILICEDDNLTSLINTLNERIYRTSWHLLNIHEVNTEMEKFKIDAFDAVRKMRLDIERSTRFELSDFLHIYSGLLRNKR
ncbi:hypothetical protein [Oxalicibacterium solurbis]|uniref:Uncharacterized protein n=1 Tax=Oxalicibacterium solurbis TaxID=69280 RepID=A0A8J3F878_9BURK|nr:hypothetical protein [Oxalicibacterium solurbis]GGI53283.1 hypothetical protein GCM10011430_04570 [Oxalicibacterium solurbis]